MSATIVAVLLSLAAIFGSTIFHYEALNQIRKFARIRQRPHLTIPTVLTFVILAHICEILIYLVVYIFAAGPLQLGHFSGEHSGMLGLFYFAAETYSSLGAGQTTPHGELRVIASISSLNGILLLAWSGAFLSAVTDRLSPRK
jgi:hypothetical protein